MSKKTKHDSETAAHGQQVITACAFIHKEFDGVEKLFLPRRADTKKFLPGVYELPGGHVDYGESMREGLAREITEEFGVKINVGDPFHAFTYTNDVKGSHSVEVIYFATFIDPVEKIMLDPEDHTEFGWFTESEIDTKVVNESKKDDDKEIEVMHKGFKLLSGGKMDFA